MFTDAGRWARASGGIPNYETEYHRFTTGSFRVGLERLQFITARRLTGLGENKVLLTLGRDEGGFRYPRIAEDWRDYDTWYWYVVDASRIASLLADDSAWNEAYSVPLRPSLCGEVREDYRLPLSLSRVADGMVEAEDRECYGGLSLRVFPVETDGRRVVRFYPFSTDGFTTWGMHSRSMISFERGSEGAPEQFDRYYYEVPYATFREFVQGASLGVEPDVPGSRTQGPPPTPSPGDPEFSGSDVPPAPARDATPNPPTRTAEGRTVERRSATLPVLGDVVSRLAEPTGWGLRRDGQWESESGRLPYQAVSAVRGGYNYTRQLGAMEIRTVEQGGEARYVLVIPNRVGSTLGWRDWFVVDAASLDALAEAASTEGTVSRVDLPIHVAVHGKDADDFVRELAADARGTRRRSSMSPSGIIVSVFPVTADGEAVVRFNLTGLELYGQTATFDPAVFDHFYYEVPASAFRAFSAL